MKTIVFINLLLIASYTNACEKQVIIMFNDFSDETTEIFTIKENALHTAALWNIGDGPEPLGVNEAYKTALNTFQSTSEFNGKAYYLGHVRIAHKPLRDLKLWFYNFEFVEDIKIERPTGKYGAVIDVRRKNVVVLMDGTAILGNIIADESFYQMARHNKCD